MPPTYKIYTPGHLSKTNTFRKNTQSQAKFAIFSRVNNKKERRF